jgi:hypothetical protein
MKYRNLILSFMMMTGLFAQSVVGIVTDGKQPLAGANVVVDGTNLGAVSTQDGSYVVDVPVGTHNVTASFIGYSSVTVTVTVGESNVNADFTLEIDAVTLSALEVLASRADETTPVAYTNVSKEDLEFRLGSQDIPMALNTTPSVYATGQGGGAGDARINVRGFNQRNVAVMINGVPQNDMENGWVYWSNWDGVADASNSDAKRSISR